MDNIWLIDLTCVPSCGLKAAFPLDCLKDKFDRMVVYGTDRGYGADVRIRKDDRERFLAAVKGHYDVCDMEEYEFF